MLEALVLGAVQGVSEWLPVSSEAMVVLVKNNFFHDGAVLIDQVHKAIFLHLGTLLAVVIYLRKDLVLLVKRMWSYQKQSTYQKAYITFLVYTTLISGIVGFMLLYLVESQHDLFEHQNLINIIVAVFLFITSLLLFYSERTHSKNKKLPKFVDALITGLFQGCAAIPGISRSGSTIAGMGLLGFEKKWVITTSFILSIPLVFFANIILNYQELVSPDITDIIGVLSAFVFGYLTIGILLRIIDRIRFSYFVGGFAVLLLVISVL